MFSEPPLPTFKGVQPNTPWFTHFQTSLNALKTKPASGFSKALDATLAQWEQMAPGLAADSNYDLREQYCILQTWLWEIYSIAKIKQMQDAASRLVYKRACKVLDQTPAPGRPLDLKFREGDDLIQKMLEHLRRVNEYYRTSLTSAGTQRAAQLPPPTAGFQRTNVLEATDDSTQAEALLQVFLGDNQYIRTILLGDATSGATIVDNCLTIPGDPIVPGRGLWIKSHTLLRQTISTWLGATLSHDYDQVRCIFISPKGRPVSYLSKTDALSYSTVSLKIVQAAKAGLV